jgi:hypothetical protein
MTSHVFALGTAVVLCLAVRGEAQSGRADGPTSRAPGGTTLKLFLEER